MTPTDNYIMFFLIILSFFLFFYNNKRKEIKRLKDDNNLLSQRIDNIILEKDRKEKYCDFIVLNGNEKDNENKNLINKLKELENQIKKYKIEEENLNKNIQILNNENKNLINKIKELQNQNNKYKIEEENLNKNIQILDNENKNLKNNNIKKNKEKEIIKIMTGYSRIEEKYNDCKELYNLIKNDYEKMKNEKTVIGIDLGSTYSSYAILNDEEDLKELYIPYIRSEIIMDGYNSFNPSEIGEVAHNIPKKNFELQNRLYLSGFKKNLNPFQFNTIVEPTYPKIKTVELQKVFEGYLSLLRKKINIEDRQKIRHKYNVKWVITIPPLWDKKGKEFMRNITLLAGMSDAEIALEPEAVSLSIFYDKDINGKKLNLKKGYSFFLVDSGGYTVDMSGFKIIDDNNNLEQLILSESFVLGSNHINEEIIKIIKIIYGESAVNNAIKNNFNLWEETLNEIEKKKIDVCGNIELKQIKLPIKFIKDSWLKKFFNLFNKKEITFKKSKIRYTNNEIFIETSLFRKIILNLVKDIANKINMVNGQTLEKPKMIIFTGGFSQCLIMRNNLKKIMEVEYRTAMKLVFLESPRDTVAKGAAIFGLKPNQILIIKCPITIGIENYNSINKNEVCEEQKEDGNCLSSEIITFANRHQSIMVNTSITKNINIISNKIKIYYSREEELSFDNANLLEEIYLSYTESLPNNRNISISMKFSNYINVTYIDNQMNENKSKLIFYP